MLSKPDSAPEGSFPPILLVEDDPTTSEIICKVLEGGGLNTVVFGCGRDTIRFLESGPDVAAAVIDISLPDIDGIEVLREILMLRQNLPCYMLTANSEPASVVASIKAGASDYFTKPFDQKTLLNEMRRVFANRTHESSDCSALPGPPIRWQSPKMRQALRQFERAAGTNSPVLLLGPRYSGKFSLARSIYQVSQRSRKAFLRVDLATMTESQIEKSLFGKSLTDSVCGGTVSGGVLDRINGGTLFLENIELLGPAAQAALVDWLDASATSLKSHAPTRLISSSTVDLEARMESGSFRRDLYFLLAIHQVEVPALAERVEDLPTLCEDFITSVCVRGKLRRPTLTRQTLERIKEHSWPHNLAELRSAIEHAVTHTADGLITPANLPPMLQAETESTQAGSHGQQMATSIEEAMKSSLIAALEESNGNRRMAAKRLKISLRTVYNMIKRYGLEETSRGARPRGKDA